MPASVTFSKKYSMNTETMQSAHKPVIAVTGSLIESRFTWNWWSWQCIRIGILLAGGIPKRIVPKKSICEFDGLLLSGGVDINPDTYGENNTSSYKCETERDQFELALLDAAVKEKKPVLGICRGAQLINVARGGTLYQEASKVFRYYTPAKTIWGKIVKLKASYISGSRWLRDIFAEDRKQYINSLHHQAIGRLGNDLTRIADDHHGMTQAIEYTGDSFMIGMQWHPEFQLYNKGMRGIFNVFVKACKSRSRPM